MVVSDVPTHRPVSCRSRTCRSAYRFTSGAGHPVSAGRQEHDPGAPEERAGIGTRGGDRRGQRRRVVVCPSPLAPKSRTFSDAAVRGKLRGGAVRRCRQRSAASSSRPGAGRATAGQHRSRCVTAGASAHARPEAAAGSAADKRPPCGRRVCALCQRRERVRLRSASVTVPLSQPPHDRGKTRRRRPARTAARAARHRPAPAVPPIRLADRRRVRRPRPRSPRPAHSRTIATESAGNRASAEQCLLSPRR